MRRRIFTTVCYLMFLSATPLLLSSCAKTEEVSGLAVTLPKAEEYRDGVPVYKSAVEIQFPSTNDGYLFEIASDEAYQKSKNKIRFQRGKIDPELSSPLTRSKLSKCYKGTYTLPYNDLKKAKPTMYWIRRLYYDVPSDVDQRSEHGGLEGLLTTFVGRPIDALTIGRFEVPYENAKNRTIYVRAILGPYSPMWIE